MMSIEIDSSDLSELLVGITPAYLNNFVQRELYGVRASVQAGQVRKQHRRFSEDDVFGIGLVWMLFEAGLRSDPICRILKDIAGKLDANAAAKRLLKSNVENLVVVRRPRPAMKQSP